MLGQAELEEAYQRGGRVRAERLYQNAQDAGRAGDSSPGRALVAQYILTLAAAIREACASDKPGPHQTHVQLLRNMDPDACALLAVRRCLNLLLSKDWSGERPFRAVAYSLGAAIHEELMGQQVKDCAPGLFHTVVRDLGRIGKDGESRRVRFIRSVRKNKTLPVREWGIEHRHVIGIWLLDKLCALGLVLKHRKATWRKTFKHEDIVLLGPRALACVDSFTESLEYAAPMYGPCVIPPLPYAPGAIGGWRTPGLQRRHPWPVRGHPGARLEQPIGAPLTALNRLMGTPWRVSTAVLDRLTALRAVNPRHRVFGEWNDRPQPGEDMQAFLVLYREWLQDENRANTTRRAAAHALAMGTMFREYPELYFVWYADTRGRMYPMTSGLNPQGSDLEKGLLEFTVGAPLTEENEASFLTAGTSLWGNGVDKLTMPERWAWARRVREDLGPWLSTEWEGAEKPVQFLAWLLAAQSGVCHVPIAVDATCSGLQHLAALSRDKALGALVNLGQGVGRADLYSLVLGALQGFLEASPGKWEARLRQAPISRAWVKPAVMNIPYGVTKHRYGELVADDFLARYCRGIFGSAEYQPAAAALARQVWACSEPYLGGARALMRWLAGTIRSLPGGTLEWTTPSGFRAAQAYYVTGQKRVSTAVIGYRSVRYLYETGTADLRAHRRAFPANYIHSMDASHAHLLLEAMPEGAPVVTVHDSFGTSLAYAQDMAVLLRVTFANMYNTSPLLAFGRDDTPTGEWTSDSILSAEYAFS